MNLEDFLNMDDYDERPSGLQYDVFNEKVVKASLIGTDGDAWSAVSSVVGKANLNCLGVVVSAYELSMPPIFTGKAKLNTDEGDTWDLDVGKDLARKRCLDKYHRNFDTRIKMVLKDARKLVAFLEHYCEKKGIDTSSVSSIDELYDKAFNGTNSKS